MRVHESYMGHEKITKHRLERSCEHCLGAKGPHSPLAGHAATIRPHGGQMAPILMLECTLSLMFNARGSVWYSKVFECDQNDFRNISNRFSELRVLLKYPET